VLPPEEEIDFFCRLIDRIFHNVSVSTPVIVMVAPIIRGIAADEPFKFGDSAIGNA
jgi:hypothetical protein